MSRPARRRARQLLLALASTVAALLVLAAADVPGVVTSPPAPPTAVPPPAALPIPALPTAPGTPPPSSSPRPLDAPATSPAAPVDCPEPASGFDCDFQRRFAAVRAYLATRPGTVGIVVHDRRTGAVWRNEHAGSPAWTASTIKLAMAVDLLLRDRSGAVHLTGADRALIHAMLHSSDDVAADILWFRYAGSDHRAYNDGFRRFGMTSLEPQRGFSDFYPYWGFQKCTPVDLERLVDYLLTEVPGDIRDEIVGELRAVGPEQQWGLWDAGPAAQPGNKDGWSLEQGGWVMNTVGFVGPAERYTVAVMNSLQGQGGYDEGRDTDGHVAQLLFGGRF